MIRFLFLILLFMLASCRPAQKDYEESFDIPLMKQNEKFITHGEYDSFIQLNKKYYQLAEKMNYGDGKALCYINLANTNMLIGDFLKSRIFFEHAEKILETSESTMHKAIFYTSYSRLKLYLKDLEKCTEYNNQALDYAKKSKDSWLKNYIITKIYFRKGNYYLLEKKYSKALESYRHSQKTDEPGGEDSSIGNFYLYYGGNLDSAQVYLTKAVVKYDKSGEENYDALVSYLTMGEYYRRVRKYAGAEKMYFKALKIAKSIQRTAGYITIDIYDELRKMYEEKGDKEKAYFYLKTFLDAKNKSNMSLLSVINKDMDGFISKAEQDSQKICNNIMILILVGLTAFIFSGIYSWETISALRQKKIKLKNDAENLKGQMNNTSKENAIELAKVHDPSFLEAFQNAYPGFTEKVLKINPDLEESELVFCAMLKLHFSSKEIAVYTFIQHRTVQQKKYRIRKKLNIPQDMDIYLFFDHLLK